MKVIPTPERYGRVDVLNDQGKALITELDEEDLADLVNKLLEAQRRFDRRSPVL